MAVSSSTSDSEDSAATGAGAMENIRFASCAGNLRMDVGGILKSNSATAGDPNTTVRLIGWIEAVVGGGLFGAANPWPTSVLVVVVEVGVVLRGWEWCWLLL